MNTGTSAERCSEAERQLQLVVIVITTERHCGDEVRGGGVRGEGCISR